MAHITVITSTHYLAEIIDQIITSLDASYDCVPPSQIEALENTDLIIADKPPILDKIPVTMPVIILTKAGNNMSKHNLHYLEPPIGVDQLYAKIENLLQQREQHFTVGDFIVDVRQQYFYAKESKTPIALTDKEVALLQLLYEVKSKPLSKEMLLEKVWKYDPSIDTRTVETHIYRLRQKLGDDAIVTTERGYILSQ